MSKPWSWSMLPVVATSNSTQKPTGSQSNNWTTTLPIANRRMDDLLLEYSGHWWMTEMGQGKLMGPIHSTQILFILATTTQSHLLPLSSPYSANPQEDPKTHNSTNAVVSFPLSWFSQSPMLMNLCSMVRSLLSLSHHITPSFCDYDVL